MVKNKIIFIDSDGTVMDSMTPKHIYAFGPSIIKTFNLEEYSDEIQKEWEKINLYSTDRGINRFDGCYKLLEYVNSHINKISFLKDFKEFLDTTKEKSPNALENYIISNNKQDLYKIIDYSNLTNKLVEDNKSKIKPFESAKLALKELSKEYMIIIVSSANKNAVSDEWTRFGLIDYVDEICCQEIGTKSIIISKMLKKYQPKSAIMIGDSLGDLDAANKNSINFYPILPSKEDESWNKFMNLYVKKFSLNSYYSVQEELNNEFRDFLKG